MVAKAGVDRLGRTAEVGTVLPIDRFLPAPGQGALAIQVRTVDRRTRAFAKRVDHAPTRAAVEAERALAGGLGASCNVPLGAFARGDDDRLTLIAEVLSADGSRSLRATSTGSVKRPAALGRRVARQLSAAGARSLMGEAH